MLFVFLRTGEDGRLERSPVASSIKMYDFCDGGGVYYGDDRE